MRVLIIGSGGREHALAWKLRQSPLVETVYIAPGNGGTALDGAAAGIENAAVSVDNVDGLVTLATQQRIDLVVPGPELPLTLGVTDAMQAAGIPCFGPDSWCARIEGSKAFAKELMQAAGVPTATSRTFTDAAAAGDFVRDTMRRNGKPLVIKADGLAAGKGVVIAATEAEALSAVNLMMQDKAFGNAGEQIVVEEFLEGEEVSLLALCDGKTALPLPTAQDHKAAFDGDTGPNTGGMGAYSPAPALPDAELEAATDLAIRPILRECARQGHPFTGVLYAGLMMTKDGPKVLEYNVRFGDPECEPLLMRLESDLVPLLVAAVEGRLASESLVIRPEHAVGIVLAGEDYPAAGSDGKPISGIAEAEAAGAKVFHAGTRLEQGQPVSAGGRVLCVTALGKDILEARHAAYEAIRHIHMPGSRYRTDIGWKAVQRLK